MKQYLLFDMAPGTLHLGDPDAHATVPARLFIDKAAFEDMIEQYAATASHRVFLRDVVDNNGG